MFTDGFLKTAKEKKKKQSFPWSSAAAAAGVVALIGANHYLSRKMRERLNRRYVMSRRDSIMDRHRDWLNKQSSQAHHDEIVNSISTNSSNMSAGAKKRLMGYMNEASKNNKKFTLTHTDGRYITMGEQQKTAEEHKPAVPKKPMPYSAVGAILGGVGGHQAAKYLGATGKGLGSKAARVALALASADRMARVKLHETPVTKRKRS